MFYLLGKLLGKILQRAFIGLFVLLLSLGTTLDGNCIRYPTKAQFTRRIREQTGLVLPQGELLESIDTHGGFHGDGEYSNRLRYPVPRTGHTDKTMRHTGSILLLWWS